MRPGVVIVGGGQAGVQAADSLRTLDESLPITILADELPPPYQRPPLSKSLWNGDLSTKVTPLRKNTFFDDHAIRLLVGTPAVHVRRGAKHVDLEDGRSIPYDALVIATGARARPLRLPGAGLAGVFQLRTLDDGLLLQKELREVRSLVVIGGGFVGLEVAASAGQNGITATVFEVQDRLLARSVTATTSTWLTEHHRSVGMDVRLSTPLREIVGDDDGRAVGVVAEDGTRVQADLIVTGVGAVPNSELAADAGLTVDDGIVVDAHLQTTDDAIWAVGDCVQFPSHLTGLKTRLESVQNATDQGRVVAKNIVAALGGEPPERYAAVPWFWSHQGAARLQIAGIGDLASADTVVRDYGGGKVTVLAHRSGALVAAETVNMPADHLAARRILANGGEFDPVLGADPAIPLTSAALSAGRSQEDR